MSCCRVPRYASSLAQAAWGWGQGSCKGAFPTQEDVGGPWGCDPSSPPHPPFQAPTQTHVWTLPLPQGRCLPHLPGWRGRDGPGAAARAPAAPVPRQFPASGEAAAACAGVRLGWGHRRRPPSSPEGPIRHPPAPEGAEETRVGQGRPPLRAPAWLRGRLPPKPEGEGRGCRDGASQPGTRTPRRDTPRRDPTVQGPGL